MAAVDGEETANKMDHSGFKGPDSQCDQKCFEKYDQSVPKIPQYRKIPG
jgi:hypothetical protein